MVWLIKSTFGKENYDLPKSLCTFFWTLVGALALQPFCWMFTLLNLRKKSPEYGISFHSGIIVSICIGLLGFLPIFKSAGMDFTFVNFLTAYGLGALLTVILFSLAIFIAWLIDLIQTGYRKLFPRKSNLFDEAKSEKKPNVLWEFIKAKKQKVCPIIQYEEN